MYNIVGAGLCGSMLAKEFDNIGIEYRIFDAKLPFSASIISENLFSDTWLKDVSYIKQSLDFIHNNYQVEKRTFIGSKITKELYHLPIPNVLRFDYINEKVIEATKEGVLTTNGFYKGVNIICAGFLAKKLFKLPYLDALTGHGFFIKHKKIDDYINTYRPYTHEKIMNWHDKTIWYGDSTAIRHNNYMKKRKEYVQASLKRLKGHGLEYNKIVFGARPMNTKDKKNGLLVKINENNIIINGGWKDGLVIYPYLIKKLHKWLK
jgi:hypothetical protein|tara:strand:+ start:1198 stop:1986 length:789 start_codon:yes stop_codon:yes gene_type:complete